MALAYFRSVLALPAASLLPAPPFVDLGNVSIYPSPWQLKQHCLRLKVSFSGEGSTADRQPMPMKFPGLTMFPDTPKELASEKSRMVCRRLVMVLEESQQPEPCGPDCGVCLDPQGGI